MKRRSKIFFLSFILWTATDREYNFAVNAFKDGKDPAQSQPYKPKIPPKAAKQQKCTRGTATASVAAIKHAQHQRGCPPRLGDGHSVPRTSWPLPLRASF